MREIVKLHVIYKTGVFVYNINFLNYFQKTLWDKMGSKLLFYIGAHPKWMDKLKL